jgi:hypothetical protein
MSRNVPAPAGLHLGFTSASSRLEPRASPAVPSASSRLARHNGVSIADGHGYEGPLAGVAGHLGRQSRATLQAEYDAVDAVLDAAFEDAVSVSVWPVSVWRLRGG